MAVENLKSSIVTDLDASPPVKINALETGGRVRAAFATDEVGGDATSTYRMIRLPGRARVTRVEFASDDLGTGCTMDVGLYDVADAAVEDADFFASAVDVATAAVARTDVTYESGVVAIENAGKALWEQLGLSDTPANRQKDFDILLTANAAAVAGTVSVWVEYVLFD